MVDLDLRFRQMDEFGDDYRQVISLPAPPIEDLGEPPAGRDDGAARQRGARAPVAEHPDRFAGFVAALPMNDPEGTLEEIDHACGELGALGVQIYTHVNGHPLDEERFEPFWAKMAEIDKPVWVHPSRNASWADYPTEEISKYEIWWVFGWEYDTAAFMARLVFSGVLERHPDLKILIHHGGSMVPHFAGRVGPGWDQLGARTPPDRAPRGRASPALEAAARLLQDVLRRHGAVRRRARDPLLASTSSGSTTCCSRPTRRSTPRRGPATSASTIADLESLEPLRRGSRRRSTRATPAASWG